MTTVVAGTCGWSLPPREYVRTFSVVELLPTCFKPPHLSSAQAWRAEAPADFTFALRASRTITHPPRGGSGWRGRGSPAPAFLDTPAVRRAWKRTVELARALDARFVVFHCPASFRPDEPSIGNLVRFFEWAHRDRLRFGWEPRGSAWTDELVRELCRELSLTHVVDPLERPCMRPRPAYYRLPGAGGHTVGYADEDLRRVLELCQGDETFCVFNNASMAGDAASLLELTV